MRSLVTSHLPLIVSATVALIFIQKVATVSRGNATTARALIYEANLFQTLLGIFALGVSVIPLIIAVLIVASIQRKQRSMVQDTLLLVMSIAVALILTPLYLILSFLFIALLLLIAYLLYPSRPFRRYLRQWSPEVALSVLSVYVLILSVSSDVMWLPAQSMRHDGETTVGYVIRREGSDLMVLRDSDRELVVIPSGAVESRHYCDLDVSWEIPTILRRPITAVFLGGTAPSYPVCQ